MGSLPTDGSSSPLTPTLSLIIKLGSIARHVEELLSDDGHDLDRRAIIGLLSDPEVAQWMADADRLALLPVPR